MLRDWFEKGPGLLVVAGLLLATLIVVSGCYNGPPREQVAPLIWRK